MIVAPQSPEPSVIEPAGTVCYLNHLGIPERATFAVRTVAANPSNYEIRSRRENDLNEQWIEVWDELTAQGASAIKYEEIHPSPFF